MLVISGQDEGGGGAKDKPNRKKLHHGHKKFQPKGRTANLVGGKKKERNGVQKLFSSGPGKTRENRFKSRGGKGGKPTAKHLSAKP